MTSYSKSEIENYYHMIIPPKTTYRANYVPYEIKDPIPPLPPKEKPVKKPKQPEVKDTQTMTPYRTPISFDLFWTRKDILRTNPRVPQERYDKSESERAHEHARRTRPRVAMVSAINVDDIENPERRAAIIKTTYNTTTGSAMKEAANLSGKIMAPFPGLPAPAIAIRLNKIQAPYVSPEWRMESMKGEQKQLRSFTDPNCQFWLKHGKRYKFMEKN